VLAAIVQTGGVYACIVYGFRVVYMSVDVREFMLGLSSVLHQQGFRLTPITLEVRSMWLLCLWCLMSCCLRYTSAAGKYLLGLTLTGGSYVGAAGSAAPARL
jgi:hypothetical protein